MVTHQIKAPPGPGEISEDQHPDPGHELSRGFDVLTMIAIVIAIPGTKGVCAVISWDLLFVMHSSKLPATTSSEPTPSRKRCRMTTINIS
jgi:hypothetical protein